MIDNKYLFNGSVEMQPEMNVLNIIYFIRNHYTPEGGPNNSSILRPERKYLLVNFLKINYCIHFLYGVTIY